VQESEVGEDRKRWIGGRALSSVREIWRRNPYKKTSVALTAFAMAAASVVPVGDALAQRFGREFGDSASTTVIERVQAAHLAGNALNDIQTGIDQRIKPEVKTALSQVINEETWRLETQFGVDINHDGIIGQPPTSSTPPAPVSATVNK
jgi:hypothetical protein